jgi:PAS domain S-box-containing protein
MVTAAINEETLRDASSSDAKESREQVRSLFENERSFGLLVENVADYALYMLSLDGTITSWNIGGQRIKGYQPSEIIGQHFSRFYTEADRAAGKPLRALAVARDHGRYEEEGWRVRKDGTFFWASVVIDPVYEDGKLVGFAKITRDITERREAQLQVEKMQKQLADSQRLDALGQLTGGVAHDFNNLLMIISGSMHYMKKAAEKDEKLLRAVKAVEAATQRGAALTSQLLSFARRQSVNPEVVDIGERVQSIRDILDTAVGRNVGLIIEVEPEVWPVKIDLSELETGLVNLVINARDAMPERGEISIRVQNKVVAESEHRGDFVAIEVTDTGVGIPADVLEKVFEPFFTTKPVGKGTGLGLSQVHGFAHQAGGFVEIASELGQGTKITIYLPRDVAGKSATTDDLSSAIGTGSVLLVEDNPDVAAVSIGMLEQLGYSVQHVSNAEAALDAIERNGIDLVFSDIVMPGKMDGIGLARRVRQHKPDLPILLTTGYAAAPQRQVEFPVLRKPYQIHELGRALAALPTK